MKPPDRIYVVPDFVEGLSLDRKDFDDEKEKASEWGYNLCKEQMMKKAIEGTLGYGPHLQRPIIMLEQVPDIWNGSCQSVKIIIEKQDDRPRD